PPPARGEPGSPTAGGHHQSSEFRSDPELGGAIQSRAGKPGTDAGRGGRADGDRPAGLVPIGNGQDAEPHARDAAQMGGSTRTEAESGSVVRLIGNAAWRTGRADLGAGMGTTGPDGRFAVVPAPRHGIPMKLGRYVVVSKSAGLPGVTADDVAAPSGG